MGKAALEPCVSIARLLSRRRRELRLSLREVQKRTEALGQVIPFTTVGRIERGRVEPGLKRLNLLLRVYDLSPQLTLELLELEQFAEELPAGLSAGALREEGVKHWKAGDLRKGLAYLLAVRTTRPGETTDRLERQKTLLAFAVAAGSLGRNRLSRQIVDELLLEPPEPGALVSVLVQAAVCWRRLGSGEAALGYLSRAAEHVAPTDHRRRAWIHHSRASTFASMGNDRDAETELTKALSAYRRGKDLYGQGRILGMRAGLRMEQGDAKGALRAARASRAHADKHGFERLRLVAHIDEGRAQIGLEEYGSGFEALREGLSASISAGDNVGRFYAHYYLWTAHRAVGDEVEAAHELQNAQHYLRFMDDSAVEAGAIRDTLAELTPIRHRTRGSGTRSPVS